VLFHSPLMKSITHNAKGIQFRSGPMSTQWPTYRHGLTLITSSVMMWRNSRKTFDYLKNPRPLPIFLLRILL